MSDFKVFRSRQAGVGKWLTGSKMQYEWAFSFGHDLFIVKLLVSKFTKKHRVFVNAEGAFEDIIKTDHFYFKLAIEDKVFEITKTTTAGYQLSVNGEPYDKISMNLSNNEDHLSYAKSHSLTLCEKFKIQKEGNYYRLTRTGTANVTPPTQVTPTSNQRISTGGFNALNDSDDFYKHDFLYLFIKEQNEDIDLVNAVNNVK